MTQEEFKTLVQNYPFLGEERQKMLLENAAWMTPEERAALASNISTTETKLVDDGKQVLEALEGFEEGIKEFTKEELPKLRAEEESKEQVQEESEANKLLDDFE